MDELDQLKSRLAILLQLPRESLKKLTNFEVRPLCTTLD